MPISNIQNYLQISPNLHTAGQPFPQHFPAIQAAGCRAVINLALPDSPDAFPEEAELVRSLGMEYIPIPVEWEMPEQENLEAFFATLSRLEGQPVFVHCARNMRVSAFVFLYRVLRLKQPRAQAERDLHKIWQPNETWQEFIDEMLSEYRAQTPQPY